MRINHNIAALNTYRQLGAANAGQSKSMEKLSSGLRINRAGDDAAGLAISEKMRGQIRGLDMAQKNSQDGISMIQTAEGALNETHSILQRMRELSVQAANDTNTSDDRAEIQKEIDQLVDEIDRIGNTTEFNTKKLINGDASQKAELTSGGTNIVSSKAVSAMNIDTYDVEVGTVSKVAANFNAGTTGIADTDLTLTGSNFDVNNSYKLVVTNYDGSANTADIALQDADGNTLISATGQSTTGAITLDSSGADEITIASGAISANGTSTFDFGMNATYTVKDSGGATVDTKTATTTDGSVSVGGFELTVDNTLTAATDATIDVTGDALQFQIGANDNQSIRLAMSDMRSAALGVDSIDVSSYSNAKDAISTIDSAIKDVSAERSKLGAYQNRLDHTINNLGTSSENLTAAESRIRDVDYALAA
ncbi:flagellin [Bacillus sp. Marseille-Q3570]|uniref:flagellin N-terminal helical domain-containing protein n=1 Tax=Bacillus sp. Marseille-Q3570 TaxID=2963522 RepID=UPI0028DBF83B|nr:flagellin [Bacillus sp. Marseille-Q3570]